MSVILLAGCQELPGYFAGGGTLLARAGGKELHLRDVASVVPKGVTGDDSVAFLEMYVDRWVGKQLKLQEAEVLFSSAEEDIDKMVEEYRQALLIRKLEEFYVDRSIDTTFTDDEIAAYYNSHLADFRLDRTLVKGRIVQTDREGRQTAKLKTLLTSSSEAQQRDLRDICEKNNFKVTDLRSSWVDFSEFLSYLPTLRSENYDPMLATQQVQVMRDNRYFYYFHIGDVRREGSPIPLDQLKPTIRRILFNQRQNEVIRRHEEELYTRALDKGDVKVYEKQLNKE